MSAAAPFTLPFSAISSSDLPRVGGKGANLGEMARAGFPVPPGFCVTTAAFDAFLAGCPGLDRQFAAMDALDGKEAEAARKVAEATRELLGRTPVPDAVGQAVLSAWRALGEDGAWAVRSSATAEDLPDASFAGQQDTYLNIRGADALVDAVRRCWISLFTDRAVLYRARSGFAHRDVKLSVVVQRMVAPDVAGILFTADPISGRRTTTSIEAGFGLGEALVGGLINADLYRVDKRTGEILEARPGDKAFAIRARPEGGTVQEPLPEHLRRARALDDATLRELTALGTRIEAHYGKPQDIEWCLEGGRLFVVQTRPITSLYPLPEPAPGDGRVHAYASFGHVQMMTDVMPPLAIEVWQLLLPIGRPAGVTRAEELPESRLVAHAGSRIFLDMTPALRHPVLRHVLPFMLANIYPDLGNGLRALRPQVEGGRGGAARVRTMVRFIVPVFARMFFRFLFASPEKLRTDAETFMRTQAEAARARLGSPAPGVVRLREARQLLTEFFGHAFLRLAPSIPVGFISKLLMNRILGHTNDPQTIADLSAIDRGLPGNVTTEMDLAVGDLIDLVRPFPPLLELLRSRPPREALAAAGSVEGGPAFLAAWDAFLARYGMRGPGEVDLSRPRYRDDPAPLIATILGSTNANRQPGEHRARHAALAREAEAAGERLVAAARARPFGAVRARLMRRLVPLMRAALGLREHPKFLLVQMLELVRDSVRDAGRTLVERGSLAAERDVFLFRFDELLRGLEAKAPVDLKPLALERRAALKRDAQRQAPFVVSSEGEIPALAARTDLPPGALAGTAASAGIAEGLARVVLDPAAEILRDGEILVAPHTDPGWTPLFVHAKGLVTEVGGLITHGSVVAREYGIPAVVSVPGATKKIRTGQRIRVDGTRGIIEILDEA